jgi:hypothetical protein
MWGCIHSTTEAQNSKFCRCACKDLLLMSCEGHRCVRSRLHAPGDKVRFVAYTQSFVQGITALPTAREACTWGALIFLCGSYEDSCDLLRDDSLHKHLKGKCVIQLASGTPEEAVIAAGLAKQAGVRYLDAFVFVRLWLDVFADAHGQAFICNCHWCPWQRSIRCTLQADNWYAE